MDILILIERVYWWWATVLERSPIELDIFRMQKETLQVFLPRGL